MIRASFNGCDITVEQCSNQPVDQPAGRDATGKSVVRVLANPHAGQWFWTVSKVGRTKTFQGYDWSCQAALKAAQEQASDAPAERVSAYSPR